MAKTERPNKQIFSNFYVVNLIIRKANDSKDLTPKEYSELFREFYLSATNGKSSKEKECLLITNTEPTLNGRDFSAFYGQFVEYTNLDRGKWFNILKREKDTEFSVPEHLKANYIQSPYFFLPQIHRFCYAYTAKEKIDPQNVENYLRDALTKFLDKNHAGKYYPEINFEKERETIKQILESTELLSLTISVSYSNDFGDKMKEFFNDDMKKGNVDDVRIVAKNKNNESIDLSKSEILRGALESSASHGTAEASIKIGRRRSSIKTSDHPAKFRVPSEAKPEFLANIFNFFSNLF